jgi:hypothetical protein
LALGNSRAGGARWLPEECRNVVGETDRLLARTTIAMAGLRTGLAARLFWPPDGPGFRSFGAVLARLRPSGARLLPLLAPLRTRLAVLICRDAFDAVAVVPLRRLLLCARRHLQSAVNMCMLDGRLGTPAPPEGSMLAPF